MRGAEVWQGKDLRADGLGQNAAKRGVAPEVWEGKTLAAGWWKADGQGSLALEGWGYATPVFLRKSAESNVKKGVANFVLAKECARC